jgi:hypothetical protein
LKPKDSEELKSKLQKLIKRTKVDIYQMNILPEDWEDKLPHSSQLTPVSWLFSLNGRAPCQAKSFRAAFEIVCFNNKKHIQVIYITQFYKSNADSHNYKMKRK